MAKVGSSVLVMPLLSEKTTLQETMGQYTFVIEDSATKVEVKKAVTALYGVKPVRVNIVRMDGKQVRFGKRMGQRANYKKAIVTLPKGKQISIHAGV
ncbi:MAG: 50S ribosomal protein L23 [Candidatus Magasanikbacteria bacterium RIFCSPHIGHO2_02_FULL_47_14]|uniref:Large ribosomal subunit protein uL23 n=1 Tax=Candidatus Magasanikbacteria bacterium RIFCSPHIGHO2_02_FULL_47_14 TaxID=1798680 RepID=A0A1F6LYW0_9BACT|nr:MAG: 50S ribosomal protein L23 [Candidatus Magasanikbacteria bacterium RIFCSPHIGHO2_02_FULL_47_14]